MNLVGDDASTLVAAIVKVRRDVTLGLTGFDMSTHRYCISFSSEKSW